MFPHLFELPFVHTTIKSYGTMMVVGFLAAMWVMARMAKRLGHNPELIKNAALYALIAGVAGARLFFVLHYPDQFRDFLLVFAVWQGGLEFLGGVMSAVGFLLVYLRYKKLPAMVYFDVMAVGLMIGLGFGRMGCFLNGCCYGKITACPVGVCFPYDSPAYNSQVRPDPARGRTEPQLKLPNDFFGWQSEDGKDWIPASGDEIGRAPLKPYTMLTDEQKHLAAGQYRCLEVHPTQLYETGYAFVLAGVLYLFWRLWASSVSGLTLSAALCLYAPPRFFNEILRDDNPFEYAWWTLYKGGTISQNICIYMMILGVSLAAYLLWHKRASR